MCLRRERPCTDETGHALSIHDSSALTVVSFTTSLQYTQTIHARAPLRPAVPCRVNASCPHSSHENRPRLASSGSHHGLCPPLVLQPRQGETCPIWPLMIWLIGGAWQRIRGKRKTNMCFSLPGVQALVIFICLPGLSHQLRHIWPAPIERGRLVVRWVKKPAKE